MCSVPQLIRHWQKLQRKAPKMRPIYHEAYQLRGRNLLAVQELRKMKSPPKQSRTLLKRKLEFTERRANRQRLEVDMSNLSMRTVVDSQLE